MTVVSIHKSNAPDLRVGDIVVRSPLECTCKLKKEYSILTNYDDKNNPIWEVIESDDKRLLELLRIQSNGMD